MGRKQLGTAVAIVIGALAIGGAAALFSGPSPLTTGDEPPSYRQETPPPPMPEPVPYDGPPNHADNRGHLQPRSISPETERDLTAAAARIKPALEAIPAADRLSAPAVEAALAPLGYTADQVDAVEQSGFAGTWLAVGVSIGDGCVSGAVMADSVELGVRGRIAEWGCVTLSTH